MRRHAKVLLAIAVICSFFTIAASSALADYAFKGTFAGPRGEGAPCPESGPGALCAPGRAAVEQSSGNLFVVDSGNERVQVFAPNSSGAADYLTEFGSAELSAPWGIAIDGNAGQTSVYVADAGNERIVKYDSDGAATPSFTVDPSFTSPTKGTGAGEVGDFHAALVIDPTTHDLLVADNANRLIERFEDNGTFVSSFDGSAGAGSPGAFAGPIDLAVNSAGDVYVVDATGNIAENEGSSKALRYSASGEYKSTLPPVGTHERVATVTVSPFDDSVVISGDQDNVYEAGPPPFQPLLGVFDDEDNPLPSPTLDAAAKYDTVAGLAIASNTADHLYVILGAGSYGGTPYGSPQVQAFSQNHPGPPAVVSQSVDPAYNEATLRATVNPGGLATKYHFEYGPTATYGQSTIEKTIPSGGAPVEVSDNVSGLTTGTGYHFRVVVSNALGDAEGPDSSFSTSEYEPIPSCSNSALRGQQGSGFLPNCRAYEQVSPVEKYGADALAYQTNVQAAANGEAATFASFGGFAGTESLRVASPYIGRRGPEGWSTAGVIPRVEGQGLEFPFASMPLGYSEQLDTAVFRIGPPGAAPGADPTNLNLYTRNMNTGAISLLSASGSKWSGGFGFSGGSKDFSHLLFETSVKLTPDSPIDDSDPGSETVPTNLYEVVNGAIRLVSVLPNGEPAPEGGRAGGAFHFSASIVGGNINNLYTEDVISEDGSRIFWTSPADAQLYLRINGSKTVKVSASQRSVPEAPQPALLRTVTPDGRYAFFTSGEKLTNDSTAVDSHSLYAFGDLYRYDTESGDLIDLTVASSGTAMVEGVLGASDDGATVYFVASGAPLTPNAPSKAALEASEEVNLYVWHNGELNYLNSLGAAAGSIDSNNWSLGELVSTEIKTSRVTPDGDRLLFASILPLTGYDNAGKMELYIYDRTEGVTRCVSCNPRSPHATAGAQVGEPSTNAQASLENDIFQTNLLSNSGERVFFQTSEALVPSDVNARTDVYMWENGRLSLISTGQSASDSYFGDAGPSGDDVFFVTRQQLVSQDTDQNLDIYDARVGGGIAAQNPSPAPPGCVGDACRPGGAASQVGPPASASVTGPGNPRSKRHKPHKKAHHKNKHHKMKHHRKKRQKQRQDGKGNHKGSRAGKHA